MIHSNVGGAGPCLPCTVIHRPLTCSPSLACGWCRSAAADQAVSLQELLRAVKAELLLKDAAVKALNRRLGQAGAQSPSDGHSQRGVSPTPWHEQQQQGSPARPASRGSTSWASGGERGGRPSAAGMPVAAAQPSSPIAGLQQAGRISFASPAIPSPAPSYLPLSALQQQQQQQQGWLRQGAASATATASHPGTTASSSHARASTGASSGRSMGAVPPGVRAALSPAQLSPAPQAEVQAEVSDQRVGFLLELVVQKRVSAAQAQQVRAVGTGVMRDMVWHLALP